MDSRHDLEAVTPGLDRSDVVYRAEESSMTTTTYDLSYWVNYGAINLDGQERKNRLRGENREYVLSTLTL